MITSVVFRAGRQLSSFYLAKLLNAYFFRRHGCIGVVGVGAHTLSQKTKVFGKAVFL